MQRMINALLVHEPSVTASLVAEHLPTSSDIRVAEVVDTLFPATDAVKRSNADVLVVACQEGSEDALGLVHWWRGARPGRPVVMLCLGSANGYVEEAFTAGADDLLPMDPGPVVSDSTRHHIEFAFRKAMARTANVATEQPTNYGKIICVLGPKGGIGKTVTSCNLSVSLALRGLSTVLVDLDLQFGDDALSLGLTPDTTSFDLAVSGGSLDAEKLDAFLLTHSSGLRVLAAPARPDQAASVAPEFIADVFGLLREEFEYVIVDTPPSFTPEVITTIDASSAICMVGMLDALSLKNTRLGMETLDLMGYDPHRVRVVLNRANTSVGITRADVLSILGRNPEILVPSHRDIARSVNEGSPVVISQRRSEAARAFESLANLFSTAPEIAETAENPRKGRVLMRRGR
jgi:pilus assembly protein CpaE